MKILLILFGTLLMNSCGCQKKTTENSMKNQFTKTEIQQNTLSGEYTVQVVENNNVAPQKLILNFNSEKNIVSGFSGCNRFSGSYKETKNSIKFGSMMATKMYCEYTSKTENVFLNALSKVTSYKLKEGVLSLQVDEKEVLKAQKNTKKAKLQKEDKVVVYSASTRGSFQEIVVYKEALLLRKDRNSEKGTLMPISKEGAQALEKIISKIDVNEIDTLVSPTKMRHYDGAAHASVIIFKNGKAYRSSGFDAGHPHKKLEVLVNKIISLAAKK